MEKRLLEDIGRINQLLTERDMDDIYMDKVEGDIIGVMSDLDGNIDMIDTSRSMLKGNEEELSDIQDEYNDEFNEKQIEDLVGAMDDIYDTDESLENAEDQMVASHSQLGDLFDSLNEMAHDGKTTGLFSDEETTMNELEIDEGHCGDNDLDEGHCGDHEDEEEEVLPTVRRSDRDRARRRPYSPKARFRGGLSEQERPPQSLDRELTYLLDEIHDDLFYTLPGEFQENNLGEQLRIYQELKSMLDSFPTSKSLPGVKQIIDRMEYDLSGLEGFNERLGELFYILTGRYEFSPEDRNS